MLTKTQFRLGLSCANKLYYRNTEGYVNQSVEDPFLQSLASGGFQIEEYARRHFPEGKFIEADYKEPELAITKTIEAFKNDGAYFEAAFYHNGLFALTDIVVKQGKILKLIEVKSKSFSDSDRFLNKNGTACLSSWKDYLYDLAFQVEVASRAFPDFKIESYFFLVDKTQKAGVDHLSQMIRLSNKSHADPRKDVKVSFSSVEETGQSLMILKDMTSVITSIRNGDIEYSTGIIFPRALKDIKLVYDKGEYPNYPTRLKVCAKCEFKTKSLIDEPDGKSGFAHCFKHQHGLVDSDFSKNFSFSLHYGFDQESPLFLSEVIIDKEFDLINGMSRSDRRLIQIEKEVKKDIRPFVLMNELQDELSKHEYPLHFIDFEAGLGPLPPIKGISPYQNIPFQFSHHVLYKDGRIEHKEQIILADVGQFPNFDFVRALKSSLGDKGTVFRYHNYENTILKMVMKQLEESQEKDKQELINFILSITQDGNRIGERNMVDLQKIIYRYYYDPATNGGNSIKDYLPAFLNSSEYLQSKYSKPIKEINLNSLNDLDGNTIWIKSKDGQILDPYKQLPPVFKHDEKELAFEGTEDLEVKNGGAALVAYAYLQYVDLPSSDRNKIIDALYRYCELDTLAMVMIYEGLKNIAV